MPPAPFTPAWVAGESRATALLPRSFSDPGARAAAVAAAGARRAHPDVVAAIRATTPAQRANREALGTAGTTCVVTGQQAGLFGGPLYTVYKAAAAIVDARALQAETGTRCVPVFWLQNEDHDFAEIASCHVLGADHTLEQVGVAEAPGEQGRSIWARTLGPDVEGALDALARHLEGLPHAPAVVGLLRSAYTPEASPDTAFRALIEALFAEHGLLVVDPCDPALRAAARPVHERAFAHAEAIGAALGRRAAELAAAGFAVQVHVRPRAPLSFVHPQGAEGARFRVEPTDDAATMRLCGTERTMSAAVAAAGPFTTSALLRPILQDSWLPTAAYVGGPGEIAYLAQVPPLYEVYGLAMPLVIPRARFRVVDPGSVRRLAQLSLTADDLAASDPELLARIGVAGGADPDPDVLEAALVDPVRAVLDRFASAAAAVDPHLARSAAKTRRTWTAIAGKLGDRYRRSLARRDEIAMRRLGRLRTDLQPDGAPQERVHAWPSQAARHGIDGFARAVVEAVVPFDGTLHDLELA